MRLCQKKWLKVKMMSCKEKSSHPKSSAVVWEKWPGMLLLHFCNNISSMANIIFLSSFLLNVQYPVPKKDNKLQESLEKIVGHTQTCWTKEKNQTQNSASERIDCLKSLLLTSISNQIVLSDKPTPKISPKKVKSLFK